MRNEGWEIWVLVWETGWGMRDEEEWEMAREECMVEWVRPNKYCSVPVFYTEGTV